MPDILLPVAISQGPKSILASQSADIPESKKGAGKAGGFADLLKSLGLAPTRVQELENLGLEAVAGESGKDMMARLAVLLRGEEISAQTSDGSSLPLSEELGQQRIEGLPSLLAHLESLIGEGASNALSAVATDDLSGEDLAHDIQSLSDSLQQFLSELPSEAGMVGSEGEVPPQGEAADEALPRGEVPDEVSPLGEAADEALPRREVPDEVLAAWVEQMPPTLRQTLAKVVELGRVLPPTAVLVSESVGALDDKLAPLQQLLSQLQSTLEKGPARQSTPSDLLKQGLAAHGRPIDVNGDEVKTTPAGKEGLATLRSMIAANAVSELLDASPELIETLRLRPGQQALQQALGQTSGHVPATPHSLASGLAVQAGAQTASLTSTPLSLPQVPPLLTPPGDAAWSQALGQRVLWMAGRQIQQAELRLSPANLGPVDIRVSIQKDQATVSFSAQHPFTREALEASLPRLREMLGEANLNLADVDVGQRDAGESGGNRWGDARQADSDGADFAQTEADDAASETLTVVRTSNGLVDDFA